MFYCVPCKLYSSMKSKDGICPTCTQEVIEIKNVRLVALIKEMNEAVSTLAEVVKSNPMEAVTIAETIKKGQKKFAKEHDKRVADLLEMKKELEVIESFCTRMGFKLDTTDEPETEDDSEPEDEAPDAEPQAS